MPKAKLPQGATREIFEKYRALADAEGEDKDCVPRAVSAATGVPYADVLRLFADQGRKPKSATSIHMMTQVVMNLGYSIVCMNLSHFNPPARAARGKHGITSHHPDRFPGMWSDQGRLICWNRDHVWAVVDGLNVDWSRGRSLRISRIYKIVKLDCEPRMMYQAEYEQMRFK